MSKLQIIHTYLSNFHDIPLDSTKRFLEVMDEYKADKNEIMTWEGDTEQYLYFVLEGVQCSYYEKEGKKHVMAFTYAPSFSGVPESFLTQTRSHFTIQTLTESRFLRISKESFDILLEEDREIERFVRKATAQILTGLTKRYYELMALSMEERFKSFMSRSAHLLQKVSHKHIASYLNMDPTNFSKLMNRTRI